MLPVVTTCAASGAAVNEDAVALGPGVAVVVDGAGLPASMRRGCLHSVAWFANELASAFRDALADQGTRPSAALAAALATVAGAHGPACDLERGSPSGTVAAWRISGDLLEYLVLGDATLLLGARAGSVTVITDDRLARVVEPCVQAVVEDRRSRGIAPSQDELLQARREALERTRNRPGGFWCAHHDAAAASEALTGSISLDDLRGVVVASDGATRGYEFLCVHSADDVVRRALDGDGATVVDEIRIAERATTLFTDLALKPHDDATLVALSLTVSRVSECSRRGTRQTGAPTSTRSRAVSARHPLRSPAGRESSADPEQDGRDEHDDGGESMDAVGASPDTMSRTPLTCHDRASSPDSVGSPKPAAFASLRSRYMMPT